jgi:cobaltochelatase CobS
MATSQGKPLKGLYDSEVIESIVQASKSERDEQRVDPYNIIDAPVIEAKAGQVLFSKAFGWEPTSIPDLPLSVFKRSDWHEEAQLHIPEIDPHWVWNRDVVERFALAMYCGDTTLLHGLQGTGKTELAVQWCAKFVIPAWRMSCNAETREAHFLGSASVDYNEEGQMYIKQEPTILTDSLRYGGLFIEDEAFRHNSALVLQSLREKNTRQVLLPDAPGRTADERKLRAPEGRWWYVLTDNTSGTGDETGVFDAQVQDASSLDRIGACIEVRYLGKSDEHSILANHSSLTSDQINGIIDFANLVRKAFEQQALLATFSVRSLLAWAEKAQLAQNLELGLRLSWYEKLCNDDKATVKDMYHQVFTRALEE